MDEGIQTNDVHRSSPPPAYSVEIGDRSQYEKETKEKEEVEDDEDSETNSNDNETEKKGVMGDGYYTTSTTVVETTEYMAENGPAATIEMPEIDSNYVKTLGGIVKLVAICLCMLTFVFVLFGGPGYYTGAGWATFVSTVGMSVTTTLLFLYIFKVVDALPKFPWIIAEMCFCFAWTIFFFIAGAVLAVAASQYRQTMGWAAAAFFAFGAMCTYGFDCYLKFLQWKNDEVATGRGTPWMAEQKRRFQQANAVNV